VFAYCGDRTLRVGDYLADVAALSAALPDRTHVVNLCTDRYRFIVGFGAALCRRQISLLPPQRTPDFLARIARAYPNVYGLADEPDGESSIELVMYPAGLGATDGEPEIPMIPVQQVAAIVFTSGSTGDPTPHAKTWGGLAQGAIGEAGALRLDRVQGATLVGTVPPQHMYGLESTVLLGLQAGLATFGSRPFYPADVRIALERVPAPRMLVTTPVHLRALDLDSLRLPPLALILSATAHLPLDLARAAEARHEAPVFEIYGFTEAGMVAYRRTVDGSAWQTLPGVAIRQSGGTWWAEGGHIATPTPLTDFIEPLDAHRFVLRGRVSDVVNVAGKRTSLAALNAHLLAIPGVRDGMYYVPEGDGAAVSRLGAFVVAPGLTPRKLLQQLRQRIDAVFLPRPLHFVERLPRNATGKVAHEALQRLAGGRRGA
jgi:acyl-coenzyme A synthetase/AMP-(fatty) acid ligase